MKSNQKIKFFDRNLITIFVISKILVITSLVGFYYYLDEFHELNLWNRYFTEADSPDFFFMPFANWDGQNYLLLADQGYNAWEPARAFFPLFPLLIRFTSLLFKDMYFSAFVVNLVLSYLFFYIFFQYASQYLSKNKAIQALTLFLCYPTSFYLTVFYSEALFLFLFLGFLYFYDAKKSNWSLLFAVLLPLTRAQAVFIPPALLIYTAIRYYQKKKIDVAYELKNMFGFALGGMLYLLFFYVATGSPFSGIQIQEIFITGHSFTNIFNPIHFFQYLISPSTEIFAYNNALIDKAFIIVITLATGVLLKSKNHLWTLLYIALFFPSASMGFGGSFIRYSLPAVLLFSLALWKTYPDRKNRILAINLLLLILQIIFIFRFSLNNWVG